MYYWLLSYYISQYKNFVKIIEVEFRSIKNRASLPKKNF